MEENEGLANHFKDLLDFSLSRMRSHPRCSEREMIMRKRTAKQGSHCRCCREYPKVQRLWLCYARIEDTSAFQGRNKSIRMKLAAELINETVKNWRL